MPIYEYTCTNCGQKTDILLGINDPTPPFCPECGAEGTLRKGFAPPAIVFKGSGWAKKDRAATRSPGSNSSAKSGGESRDGASDNKSGSSDSKTAESSSKTGESSATSPTSSTGGGTAAD